MESKLNKIPSWSFSQRNGLKPTKAKIQLESIDKDLQNALWNTLSRHYWPKKGAGDISTIMDDGWHRFEKNIFELIWSDFFGYNIDSLPTNFSEARESLSAFFFKATWNEVFDLLGFVSENHEHEAVNKRFIGECNSVLEKQLSAYRFVGKKITKVTSKSEIESIESALSLSSPFDVASIHFDSALKLLSDVKKPDFRNSIKESISAVEATCRIITKKPKITLGDALKEIERTKIIKIHPALKNSFLNLYGYTSDEGGIRHSLLDEPNLDFDYAKFMLVSCSCFVGFLISKAEEAKLEF